MVSAAPRYLTGDLVIKEPLRDLLAGRARPGIVIGVSRANHDDRMAEVYPYVYYVYFQDGKLEGPLYQSELHRA